MTDTLAETPFTKWELRRKAGEAYGKWYWAKTQKKPQVEIVQHILDYRRYRTQLSTGADETNENGNTVFRDIDADQQLGLRRGNANFYDAHLPAGWEPHPTWQDADFFGVWVHQENRMIFTYAEGDRTLVICPTEPQFRLEYDEMRAFYQRAEERL